MITSASNTTIKRLAQLHDRRARAELGLYLVEGVRLVEEALNRGIRPETVLVAPPMLRATARGRALHERLLHQHGLEPPLDVTPGVLRQVAATETPSGIVATLPRPAAADLANLPRAADLTLVLDGIQDPGNAGTILRTAAAARIDAVVALSGCVDLFAPKVVRAAMGAHLQVALAVDVEVAAVSRWTATRGQVLLADANAPASLYDANLREPTVLIVGSEAHGATVSEAIPGLQRVTIPMPGDTESLNVAVATAVILFEALRQRR